MINEAVEKGIRQFLDIGTGIPTSPNLHEVVQAVAPESRVVYVGNDPIVLVHARALMMSTHQDRTAYVQADIREPEKIFSSAPRARAVRADLRHHKGTDRVDDPHRAPAH